jgi:hypothetical protein
MPFRKELFVSQASRVPRGETVLPPSGFEIIRAESRYFPVRLHLHDPLLPGATAFRRSDGSVVSYAKRLSAIVFLYKQQRQ